MADTGISADDLRLLERLTAKDQPSTKDRNILLPPAKEQVTATNTSLSPVSATATMQPAAGPIQAVLPTPSPPPLVQPQVQSGAPMATTPTTETPVAKASRLAQEAKEKT